MDVSQFGARDLLLFFGAYALWCVLAVPIWIWAGRRGVRPWRKSLLAGVCFAPALLPIAREAMVVAPALPTLILFAAFELLAWLRGGHFSCDAGLCWMIGATALMPFALVVGLHALATSAIAAFRRRRAARTP